MRRIDLQVDRLTVDTLVAASYASRLVLDLSLDVAEVGKPPVRNVMELSPLVPRSRGRVPVAGIQRVLGLALGDVDQL